MKKLPSAVLLTLVFVSLAVLSDCSSSQVTTHNAGAVCKLNGQYAFLFSGNDAGGVMGAAGEFAVNSAGTVTGGVEDVNTGSVTNPAITGGSCSTGTDNRGTLTLTAGGTTTTYKIAVMANGNAKMIEFDDSTGTGTRGSGIIKKQDPTAFSVASLAGDFAFSFAGVFGVSSNSFGNIGRLTITANGSTAAFSKTVLDWSQPAASETTTLSVPSAINGLDGTTGRGTATETFDVSGTPQTSNFAFYVVSANEQFFLEIDSTSAPTNPNGAFVLGEQLRQTGAGSFGASSFPANAGMVFSLTGFDTTGVTGADVLVGRAVGDGAGKLSGEVDENDRGVNTAALAIAGTYSINTGGDGNALLGTRNFSLAMINQKQAFLLEGTPTLPGSNVAFGLLEPQSGTPFTAGSIKGTFAAGTTNPATPNVNNSVGQFTLDGVSAFTGTLDMSSSSNPFLQSGVSDSGTYALDPADATGSRVTVNITSGGVATATAYIVSSTKVVAIISTKAGDANAAVVPFEQ